jgi:oligosaccharide repeat unit polymerase
LYGGYLMPLLQKKLRGWCLLSILPAMLIALTQAMKLNLVTGMLLWLVGLLVSSYANHPDFLKIRAATIVKIGLSMTLIFGVLFLSMMFKAGTFDAQTADFMRQRFVEYAFGHLPVFDAWFTGQMGHLEPTGGIKTFYGITNFLGLAERQQGVFTEFVYFCKSTEHQVPLDLNTNVFTAFRFILEDFGFIGSFVALLLAGVVSGFSWMMVRKKRGMLLFQTVLTGVLFFIGMSFATSVWVYTSYLATMVLFFGLIRFSFQSHATSTQG